MKPVSASDPPVVGMSTVSKLSLIDDRDAVERTADAARRPLPVERVGDLEHLRVHRDHRVDLRSLQIVGADAREVREHERARRHRA